jgi:hypothetical protein
MSGPNTTHWPNRPERPFWWFNEWGPGVPFASLDDEPSRTCCISSIQLSNQGDVSYFDILISYDGNTEIIARLLVPQAATLSIAYPTPLVVGGGRSPWQLSFGPRAAQGLFQSTFVGYDADTADESAAPSADRKPRITGA